MKKYDIRERPSAQYMKGLKYCVCSRRGNHTIAVCKTKTMAERIAKALEAA